MIPAHGGRLVDRIADSKEREELLEEIPRLPRLVMTRREAADFELIATGAMSPLEGFMKREDYTIVRDLMRLSKGLVWTLPVTLAVKEGDGREYPEGSLVALEDPRDGQVLGA